MPASLLHRFRSDRKHLPLHPLERAVLTVVALHLCFLPWALGTMHVWSQLTSLSLSLITFTLALIPRTYSGDNLPAISPQVCSAISAKPPSGFFASVSRSENRGQTPAGQQAGTAKFQVSPRATSYRLSPLPRLLKFPLFWIGLALLGYIVLQALNPSWVWERNATTWWLRRVNDIPWLPTSIDTPFERFNLWRQFIIYASAWLTICTVWVGFTRRRSLEILLTVLALNGILLALTGFVCRMLRPPQFILWFDKPWVGVSSFASFIYKNHAGAWLALLAVVFVVLAAVSYERSRRKLERSSPAVLFVLGAMPMLLAVIYTFSRGGTVLLAAYFLLALGVFVLHRLLSRQGTTTHPLVTLSVTLMMLLALGYAVSLLDFRRVEQRFDQLLKPEIKDVSYTARLEAHLASTAMLGEHWRRGVGAGGFRFLYPEYIKQHPAIYQGGRLFWEHAHNDWLQIPIELGAAGGLLLLAGAAYWLCALFRHRVWRDLPAVLLCLGLAQTLVHATFDFPLQNPAILTTWCALAVLALRHVELDEAR